MTPSKADREKALNIVATIKRWDKGPSKSDAREVIAQALANQREEDAKIAEVEPEPSGEPPIQMKNAMRLQPEITLIAACRATKRNIASAIRNQGRGGV